VIKGPSKVRSELTLIVDYQRLSGGGGLQTTGDANNPIIILPSVSTRWTGTLNYVFHMDIAVNRRGGVDQKARLDGLPTVVVLAVVLIAGSV